MLQISLTQHNSNNSACHDLPVASWTQLFIARHRLATFSGPFEALTIALQHVAENMQTEAETESDEVRRAPGMAGTVGMDVAIA